MQRIDTGLVAVLLTQSASTIFKPLSFTCAAGRVAVGRGFIVSIDVHLKSDASNDLSRRTRIDSVDSDS